LPFAVSTIEFDERTSHFVIRQYHGDIVFEFGNRQGSELFAILSTPERLLGMIDFEPVRISSSIDGCATTESENRESPNA